MLFSNVFVGLSAVIAYTGYAAGTPVPEIEVTTSKSPPAAMFDAPSDYAECSGFYNGCGSDAIYKNYNPKMKRKIAYYADFYGTFKGEGRFDEAQLEGLTNLILFQVDARKLPLEFLVEDYQAPKDIVKRARDKNITVSAAFGGWNADDAYMGMKTARHAEVLGEHIAAFAVSNNLDGIDINHQHPRADQAELYPVLIKTIREKAPGLIVSMAVPGIPHAEPSSKPDDPNRLTMAGYMAMIPKIKEDVDFFDLMTYDLVDHNSEGAPAFHHASLSGIQKTVDYYANLGVSPSRMNVGFAMYAKYFPMSVCDGNGLSCSFDTNWSLDQAGTIGFGLTKNGQLNKDKFKTENQDKAEASFLERVIPKQGTAASKEESTYDGNEAADSLYDKERGMFWTWRSPYAIEATCEAIKTMKTVQQFEKGFGEIGGQSIFSLDLDSADLVHIKAWQNCVKDWK